MTGRLEGGEPPVLGSVEPSCQLISFVPDRPGLSILWNSFHNILAVYQTDDLTMVLTAAQTATFFEHADQRGIPHTTVMQLRAEGIEAVADLADFDKDSLQQLADNLRHPGGHVPDPNPGAPAGATIPTPPFVFGAKSQKRIAVAYDLVRVYATVGHDFTTANLQWNTIMKNFKIQWKALKERKVDDSPHVPKISKALPVIKWTEAFQDFLNRKVGNCNIPLAYIIRDEPNPPAAAPPLGAGKPHSIEHGSIESVTEFRQPLQVQSHLEMPRILVQLGHTQRTWKLAPQTDPKWSPTRRSTRYQDQMSVKFTRRTLRMPSFTRAPHAQPSVSNFTRRDSDFGEPTRSRGTTRLEQNFPTSPQNKKTKLTHRSLYMSLRTILTPHVN